MSKKNFNPTSKPNPEFSSEKSPELKKEDKSLILADVVHEVGTEISHIHNLLYFIQEKETNSEKAKELQYLVTGLSNSINYLNEIFLRFSEIIPEGFDAKIPGTKKLEQFVTDREKAKKLPIPKGFRR